ncbi:hypothetical protein [Hahella ganghwensis]|uniref:hypothetical protein n=1 Tax=Hahella ganghwensis TaxID=286420 RepID=UPI00037885A1|nr:hypothetical protein [Hahella ganghwensis]
MCNSDVLVNNSPNAPMNLQRAKEKAFEIYSHFYPMERWLTVKGAEESLPLVAANVVNSTNSFSAGQLVYIYDGHWGMGETVKVVGRYRKKNRLIKGHVMIKNLISFRPKIIFNPAIIKKLEEEFIPSMLFAGFAYPDAPYRFKVCAELT